MKTYAIDDRYNYAPYRDSTVLIVGGGPSTNEVPWENLLMTRARNEDIEADFVWSCNDFYKNEKLRETHLDLVTLGNLTNFQDPLLHSYLDTHLECNILLELSYLYENTERENENFFKKYRDRCYYGKNNKDYCGIVGPPARLMTLACNIGVGKILFVGIDGFDENLKNAHAFTQEDGLREGAAHNTYSHYYRSLTTFFTRIYEDFGDRVKFQNLGELAESHNIPSFVSRDKYPLEQSLIDRIL